MSFKERIAFNSTQCMQILDALGLIESSDIKIKEGILYCFWLGPHGTPRDRNRIEP